MSSSLSEQFDHPEAQFNLATMLLLLIAAVAGTTLLVWALHFLHLRASATGAFPSVAIFPLQSSTSSPADIAADQKLTQVLTAGIARISRVEAIPLSSDANPASAADEFGVRLLLIGAVDHATSPPTVSLRILDAHSRAQLWTATFRSPSNDPDRFAAQINSALAPHLTALLD